MSEIEIPEAVTVNGQDQSRLWEDDASFADDQWAVRLSVPGPMREDAIGRLHALMLHAARVQVSRMTDAGPLGAARREEIVNSAADEATVSVLCRLSSFEGRSRFTTWAYKFAVLHAAVAVRRAAWRDREIFLHDAPEPSRATTSPAPDAYVAGRELANAIRAGLGETLTPHQRQVTIALLIDEVPVDVLADRLGTNRGALYKTLHDARKRLRAYLSAQGFLPAPAGKERGK